MRKLTLLAALLCLSGCYPIYKTLQPTTRFVVVDEDNQPIRDAEVMLISNAYPYGREKSRMSKTTNGLGEVEFNSMHEMRMETFMIHGREEFFWNWCIYKNGYETSQSHYKNSDDFPSEKMVVLTRGNAQPCDTRPD